MALFTDDGPSCLQDWLNYDSKLSYLGAQEITSIEAKSILAKEELSSELVSFIIRNDNQSVRIINAALTNVIVTEPLKRWHCLKTLALYYADLASLQVNQAHKEAAAKYEERAFNAKKMLFSIGVGHSYAPIPQATAWVLTKRQANLPRAELKARIQLWGPSGAVGKASSEFWLISEEGEQVSIRYPILPMNAAGWRLLIRTESDFYAKVLPGNLKASDTMLLSELNLSQSERLEIDGQQPEFYVRRDEVIRP